MLCQNVGWCSQVSNPQEDKCHLWAVNVCLALQSNYQVFMAELFWWFEVVKPSFVQPRVVNPNGTVHLNNPVENWKETAFLSFKKKHVSSFSMEFMLLIGNWWFSHAVCEATSSCGEAVPVSSPIKQSYADRPSGQENLSAEGILDFFMCSVCFIFKIHFLLVIQICIAKVKNKI